jgi:hypothetical protein
MSLSVKVFGQKLAAPVKIGQNSSVGTIFF